MINKMKERFAAMKMSGKKGFTLIELVVVIAIMAILALIMVPNLTAYIKKADTSKIQSNLKNVHTAAEMVYQTEGLDDAGAAKFSKIEEYVNVPTAADSAKATGTYGVKVDSATGVVTVEFDGHSFNGKKYLP